MRAKRITVYGNVLVKYACKTGLQELLGMNHKQLKNKTFRCSVEVLKKKLMKDIRMFFQFVVSIVNDEDIFDCFLNGEEDSNNIDKMVYDDYDYILSDIHHIWQHDNYKTISSLLETKKKEAEEIEEEVFDFIFNRIDWKKVNQHIKNNKGE